MAERDLNDYAIEDREGILLKSVKKVELSTSKFDTVQKQNDKTNSETLKELSSLTPNVDIPATTKQKSESEVGVVPVARVERKDCIVRSDFPDANSTLCSGRN